MTVTRRRGSSRAADSARSRARSTHQTRTSTRRASSASQLAVRRSSAIAESDLEGGVPNPRKFGVTSLVGTSRRHPLVAFFSRLPCRSPLIEVNTGTYRFFCGCPVRRQWVGLVPHRTDVDGSWRLRCRLDTPACEGTTMARTTEADLFERDLFGSTALRPGARTARRGGWRDRGSGEAAAEPVSPAGSSLPVVTPPSATSVVLQRTQVQLPTLGEEFEIAKVLD